MRIHAVTDIAASPQAVFAVLADSAIMPKWQADLVSFDAVDDSPWGVGKKFRQVRKAGLGNVTSTAELTQYEPGNILAIKSDDSDVKALGAWKLAPSKDGTRFELDIAIDAAGIKGFAFKLIEKMANKQAAKDLVEFKSIVEQSAAS